MDITSRARKPRHIHVKRSAEEVRLDGWSGTGRPARCVRGQAHQLFVNVVGRHEHVDFAGVNLDGERLAPVRKGRGTRLHRLGRKV